MLMTQYGAWNAEYIDSKYKLWQKDPDSVSQEWQTFFKGFEFGRQIEVPEGVSHNKDYVIKQSKVEALIYRYRDLGHLLACLDPLVSCPTDHPLLNISAFGLTTEDLNISFFTRRFSKTDQATLGEIIKILKETYCRSIGVEYMHIQDPTERKWLQDQMEPVRNKPQMEDNTRLMVLKRLCQATLFEEFLQKKYLGQKRFSLEGAEVIIPMLDHLSTFAFKNGCRQIVLGMAHRGRLNVQANILRKSYEDIFTDFENYYDKDEIFGAGDVKYHKGFASEIPINENASIRIQLVNNPSHLESVNPVAEGIARAKLDQIGFDRKESVLPVLIHGDAAFAGQGVTAETLNFSQLDGYKTGGSIHIIINNQIGYTTLPEDARSTRYSTDVAKGLMVPVFHVHGENPEAVVHVIRMAALYRNRFAKDVVVDVVCYRRYGHNEGDEPYFTQPLMYDRIRKRSPLHKMYYEQLAQEKVISEKAYQDYLGQINNCLEKAHEAIKQTKDRLDPKNKKLPGVLLKSNRGDAPVKNPSKKTILELSRQLNQIPEGFTINSKLKRIIQKRQETVEKGENIDWANAELLCFATLLAQGTPVRLSGQDSQRGTFSQRHSAWVDTKTNATYIPLSHIHENQAPFYAYNSSLSEAGILGFEYGYSLERSDALIIWEAQFGDFANNAQGIIDTYLAAGESKWQINTGLVLFLPHGYEDQGPEHSSARLERYLQLCAQENMIVCFPSTPSQHFHLLRRQVYMSVKKPLIIMTPKSLLRHPLAVSTLKDLTEGGFEKALDDPYVSETNNIKRILLCTGKIYYDLIEKRQESKRQDIAVVRVEQLYPFPHKEVKDILGRYKKAEKWCWVQEEPENMGAYRFIQPLVQQYSNKSFEYIGRNEAASPAVGIAVISKMERAEILKQAIYD